MRLTALQTLIMIGAVALGAMFTRFTPFLLFPDKKQQPPLVLFLGRQLPAAMMGLLVIYCLKDVAWLAAPHGVPELVAVAAVIGLQQWRHNVLLSIGVSTVLYMYLVQKVFG